MWCGGLYCVPPHHYHSPCPEPSSLCPAMPNSPVAPVCVCMHAAASSPYARRCPAWCTACLRTPRKARTRRACGRSSRCVQGAQGAGGAGGAGRKPPLTAASAAPFHPPAFGARECVALCVMPSLPGAATRPIFALFHARLPSRLPARHHPAGPQAPRRGGGRIAPTGPPGGRGAAGHCRDVGAGEPALHRRCGAAAAAAATATSGCRGAAADTPGTVQ